MRDYINHKFISMPNFRLQNITTASENNILFLVSFRNVKNYKKIEILQEEVGFIIYILNLLKQEDTFSLSVALWIKLYNKKLFSSTFHHSRVIKALSRNIL